MISAEEFKQIVSENLMLQVQMEELNAVLAEREKEIAVLKGYEANAVELQSRLDSQLDEFYNMQNLILKKERQAEGAEEREMQLHEELTDAAGLQQQYNDLFQKYTHLRAEFNDILDELAVLNGCEPLLQQALEKKNELESQLANTVMERDELKARINTFEILGQG